MSLLKDNLIKKDFLLYFLLFFTPLLNFIINNLYFYNINYFFDIILIFFIIFLLIIFSLQVFSYFHHRFIQLFYFFFILWYLQFYYRDIYHFLNLDFNSNQTQKYLIVFFLILISSLIFYLSKIKKFKFFIKIFLFTFLFLNLVSNLDFMKSSDWKYEVDKRFLSEFNQLSDNSKKENIYFFLMDEMTSSKIYRNLGMDINDYIEMYKSKGYKEFRNVYSNYNGSQITIGSLFNLDYYPVRKNIKEEYFYPYNLYNKEKPLLIKILDKLNYNFWYLDNQYMKCKSSISVQCINETNESFFHKILFDEALNIFFYKSFLNKFFYKYKFNTMNKIYKNTEIDYFKSFIEKNKKILSKKNNFFFIHQMNPHYPFRNKNCDVLKNPYEVNIENYLSSTNCALEKINEITDIIQLYDNKATVIFQGDHGFSEFSKKNTKDLRSFEIFNLVKLQSKCSIDNESILGNIDQFRSILMCSFEKKYNIRSSKKFYVKKRIKKIGTVLDEIN